MDISDLKAVKYICITTQEILDVIMLHRWYQTTTNWIVESIPVIPCILLSICIKTEKTNVPGLDIHNKKLIWSVNLIYRQLLIWLIIMQLMRNSTNNKTQSIASVKLN